MPASSHSAKPRRRTALQLDHADAPLDDRDLDHAVADRLLRQVGLGEEVAALAVIGAHLGGGVGQPFEVELLADELLHDLAQRLVAVAACCRKN